MGLESSPLDAHVAIRLVLLQAFSRRTERSVSGYPKGVLTGGTQMFALI